MIENAKADMITPLITPLITSAEVYPKLEQMVASAKQRVLLSFRIFDTRTSLRTEQAREIAQGDDWAALLVGLAQAGVDIRLQVSDFDPIGGAELHRDAWASLSHLNEIASHHPDAQGRIEAMAARHPAAVGPIWRRIFRARAKREVNRISSEHGGDIANTFPGLRNVLKGALPHLYPATHHQKLAVVDDGFALIGGLDLNERRWDTPGHDRPAEETWRDVSLAVHGEYVAQVARAAGAIWKRCAEDFAADTSPKPTLASLKKPTPLAPVEPPENDNFTVCLTSSVDARGLMSFGPKTVDDGTLQTVLSMIRSAQEFLYIETQFLRSATVAQALADAAARNPKLELVLVLPFAPERFAFSGRRDTAMRHAEALQIAAIEKIRDAFGGRQVILSPAKPTRQDSADKFVAYGAGIVYVHSKVLIADGAAALVGSANLNDRSLCWDTEASAFWRDPVKVPAFFEMIAASWLGDVDGPLNSVSTWQAAAEHNKSVAPDLREGFLLPYHAGRARRFSRRAFWLPNALF